ncbi:fructosamine kinase [Aureobasidium pullulans]|uniref:protein-ribulosamine 3-kinase n=1 Tax=Aureobasidium pullulans TaxID=5580 RepID=A0A4T0ESX7_AURPU|nr:fructosamine kinase [Aureobasidium pullulans]TIA77717.1 fructosamine kinase [Aureobasidium pullulans]
MTIDSAVAQLLSLDPKETTVSGSGGSSFSSTSKITTKLGDGTEKQFFMKTGSGKEASVMFEGEHASLSAIHNAVPTLCPQSYGHGTLADSPSKHFLVTDFLDLSGRRGSSTSSSAPSLAAKLAKLHSTPAPPPPGESSPKFGFPATTCCGETPQDNSFKSSWAEFYAENRLMFILKRSEKTNGPDEELRSMIEKTCKKVVPRLIGDDHLNGGKGVTPVIVHGDLWSGNASAGKLPGMEAPEDIVFDSSACYAHSEFELGIMKMFGGFGGSFLKEYHELLPKTEPAEEYTDRVALYELYHHLNHHAMFGGGYKSGAMSIMRNLISRYGD